MKIAIVVLNWNGLNHLKKFLPSVIKYSDNNPIYIIDNNSTDKSIEFIKSNFSSVNLILHDKNYGYSKGYNHGLKKVKEEVYCLLNNDVQVTKGWLTPIKEEFTNNKSVVIAQPKILDYKDKSKFEHAGAAGGFIDYFGYPYCRGRIFNEIEEDNGQYDQNIDIFWASGACFFIRKNIFEKLNGFDENFGTHMEEIDLCWRLTNLNLDYKKRFIYKSEVYHLGGGSLSYENPKKLFYNIRNHRWMVLKNINAHFFLDNLRLSIIQNFSLLYSLYFLLTFKMKHFIYVIKAMFSVSAKIDGYNVNVVNRNIVLKSKSKKPKYYSIKSIIYHYLIKGQKKYSDLT